MLNANTKKVIFVLSFLALFFILGCSSPEEKRAKSLAEVAQLKANGNNATALELLEKLSQNFPDDSEILQQIGLIYKEQGNYSEAAFYLDAASKLSPENPELIYQAYLAYEKADQPETAHSLLEAFAKANTAAMTNTLWFRLGELRAQAQKTKTALEAYLEGVKLTDNKPSSEIALTIGTLFKRLNNIPMAKRWLVIAANNDDPNALPALFGLLEISRSTKSWEAAEQVIALLDKKFPGALDASHWAKVRGELEKWRAAQAEMQAQLEKMAQAEKESQAEKEVQAEPAVASGKPDVAQETPPKTSGKGQVAIDVANAEAIADAPASEATPEEAPVKSPATQSETSEPTVVFDPNIIIQPAEPDLDTDSKPVSTEDQDFIVDYSTELQSSKSQSEPDEMQSAPPETQPEPLPEPAASLPDTTPLSLDELIESARQATSRRNYKEAIRLYWDALGLTNERADIWNELSKVYLIDGQAKNAATTALEATRLNPENIQYVLDYLRVVQRVKKPADFIKELEIAYDRFPSSPEVTLSLARGYERIGMDNYAASILYRRFIKMAPNHPLRREAEAALARMR